MASKGKGNIFYEILIAVLTVALIATILYPSKTWKQQNNDTEICQTRMATIQQFELQYIGLTNNYSDSVDKVIETVLADPSSAIALDSLVYWDGLVEKAELKKIVMEKDLPQALKENIKSKIMTNQPLGNLAVWDSVQYKLIDELKAVLAGQDSLNTLAVDSSVVWDLVINDDVYAYALDSDMPSRAKSRVQSAMRKNTPIYETAGWEYLQPVFYDSLNQLILLAEIADVWEKSADKEWEKVKRAQFEAELDALSQTEKDSLWQDNQHSFWEKVEPLVWQDERKSLFDDEGEAWKSENEATWQRMIAQEWEASRKKQWQEDQLATLADSAVAVFKAEKDSLWRSIVSDLRDEEYAQWEADNSKHIEEVVRNLWEQERRPSWKETAYAEWLEENKSNPEKVWKDLKEYLWMSAKLDLWKIEEEKLAKKRNALMRLDYAIQYDKLLSENTIDDLVNSLTLPDSKGLLKKMNDMKEFKGSKLAALGVVELFRDQLLAHVTLCPLAGEPELVNVDNTAMPKWVSIECPIVVTDTTQYALVLEKSMDDSLGLVIDTSKVTLKLGFSEKMLGGGKILNHGKIDEEGRKSWEKKGR